ncbi:MAG: hypothetical protein WBF43_06345 [Methylocella sp.]
MPLRFAIRRGDFFAVALSLVDIEIRPSLAKFFESPIASFERIAEPGRATAPALSFGA